MSETAAPSAAPTGGTSAPAPSGNGATGSEAPAHGTTAPPPPPAWKPPPLKVYGVEREVSADVYHRHAQMGAAFTERQQELARKEAELAAKQQSWQERLKTDPWSVLKEAGVEDPRRLAAQYVISRAEEEQETPEQRQYRETAAENERLRAEKADFERKSHEEKTRAVRERYGQELSRSYAEALKAADIPEGPVAFPFVMKMAQQQQLLNEMLESGQMSQEDAAQYTPQVLAQIAVEQLRAEDLARWGKLGGAGMVKSMGPEIFGALVQGASALRGPELLSAVGETLSNAIVEAVVADLEAKQAGGRAPLPAPPKPQAQRQANGQFAPVVSDEFAQFLGRK